MLLVVFYFYNLFFFFLRYSLELVDSCSLIFHFFFFFFFFFSICKQECSSVSSRLHDRHRHRQRQRQLHLFYIFCCIGLPRHLSYKFIIHVHDYDHDPTIFFSCCFFFFSYYFIFFHPCYFHPSSTAIEKICFFFPSSMVHPPILAFVPHTPSAHCYDDDHIHMGGFWYVCMYFYDIHDSSDSLIYLWQCFSPHDDDHELHYILHLKFKKKQPLIQMLYTFPTSLFRYHQHTHTFPTALTSKEIAFSIPIISSTDPMSC